MTYLVVFNLGTGGVNVDLSPIHILDNQFTKAQNMISDPLGVEQGLKIRPGLVKINSAQANGPVLGGVSVPITNQNTGTRYFLIGQGSES